MDRLTSNQVPETISNSVRSEKWTSLKVRLPKDYLRERLTELSEELLDEVDLPAYKILKRIIFREDYYRRDLIREKLTRNRVDQFIQYLDTKIDYCKKVLDL